MLKKMLLVMFWMAVEHEQQKIVACLFTSPGQILEIFYHFCVLDTPIAKQFVQLLKNNT